MKTIHLGPASILRICELLRASGKKEPTVCDIAILLDCEVMEIIRAVRRFEAWEHYDGPLCSHSGVLTTEAWFYESHPELARVIQ